MKGHLSDFIASFKRLVPCRSQFARHLLSAHRPIHRTDRRYSHSRSVLRVMSHHLFSQHDHCPMRALIALAYA